MKFIPLDAIVAEIDRRISILQKHPMENHKTICHLDSLKQSINSLEVKEVDIEKEVIDWWNAHYSSKAYTFEGYTGHYIENSTLIEIAKHFYELGMVASNKTQKGEEV